ncbi:MAG: hypothetical protein ACRENK_15655 [Gemmatimonadaceae bacterium]
MATTLGNAFSLGGSGSWYGMTFANGASSNAPVMILGVNTAANLYCELCTFALIGSGANGRFRFGVQNNLATSLIRTKACTFQFGGTGQGYSMRTQWEDIGSNISSGSGSQPVTLFLDSSAQSRVVFQGSDLSSNPNTYFPGNSANWFDARLINCALNASATILATQSADHTGNVYGFDCDAGDVHYTFFHYNYRGNTVMSDAVYVTSDGASYDGTHKYSMKVTGVNAARQAPYFGPWIDQRADADVGSAVTPSLELARLDSSTKFNNDQVWGEFAVKDVLGSTRSSIYSDPCNQAGTPAALATGVGTSAWAGSALASMKVDPGMTVTPAEIGYMRARVVVGTAATVYVDPQIRGI